MRTHNFADNLNAALFEPGEIILRMRYYLRCRFNRPPGPKKGRVGRRRKSMHMVAKPWKR